MTRTDLQKLALARLEDARILLDNQRHDAAYYLAGYVAECALKACIAKRVQEHEFPDLDFARRVYTHNLEVLLEAADLTPYFQEQSKADTDFAAKWDLAKDWSEKARYETHGAEKAKDMLLAVGDPDHGVLQCIRRFW